MVPCSVSVRGRVGHLCRGLQVAEWVKLNRMRREREAVDGLLVPSVGCRWLSGMCEILTMKCLFHTSASRGLAPSFWTILYPTIISDTLFLCFLLSLCVTHNTPSAPMMFCLSFLWGHAVLLYLSFSLSPHIHFLALCFKIISGTKI